MSIRIEHLAKSTSPDAYVRAQGRHDLDVLNATTHDLDMLAVVRRIMRDRACDMIPVVVAAVVTPVNEWGHNFVVEVEYARCGWRAVYGAHIGSEVTKVTCYMD